MLTAGQILTLAIEKPAAGGPMIARLDGQVVLVTGAIPGETVRARVERVRRGVAYADTVAVESPSPDRRDVFADPRCGGCLYGHMAYERQLEVKSHVIADAFQRIARLPLAAAVPVAASPEYGYRMRARLHVRGARIGFYRENTHEVCDARQTGQLLPSTCDVLDRLGAAMASLDVHGVGEIEMSENIDASERAVFLDASTDIAARTLENLGTTDGLTGIASPSASRGSPYVIDRVTLGGVSIALRRHVLAFFQGNRHLLTTLVSHVVGQVPIDGDLVDLYAGAGLFAVAAGVSRGARVIAVESDRIAAADLSLNASAVGESIAPVHEAVEDFVRHPRPTSTVIVDPPRVGLSSEALAGVTAMKPSRLIYVSCDVATLARDARRIVDAGYGVERIDAFDMFPNTPHIETVVVFRS